MVGTARCAAWAMCSVLVGLAMFVVSKHVGEVMELRHCTTAAHNSKACKWLIAGCRVTSECFCTCCTSAAELQYVPIKELVLCCQFASLFLRVPGDVSWWCEDGAGQCVPLGTEGPRGAVCVWSLGFAGSEAVALLGCSLAAIQSGLPAACSCNSLYSSDLGGCPRLCIGSGASTLLCVPPALHLVTGCKGFIEEHPCAIAAGQHM